MKTNKNLKKALVLAMAMGAVFGSTNLQAFAEGDDTPVPGVEQPADPAAPKEDPKEAEGETPAEPKEDPKEVEGETPADPEEDPKEVEGETPADPKEVEGETPADPKEDPKEVEGEAPADPEEKTPLEKAIEESVAKAKEAGITSEFLLNYLRKAKTPEGARNLADELVKSHNASNPEKPEDPKEDSKEVEGETPADTKEQTELEKAIEESVAKAKEAGITSEFLLNYLRKAKTPEGARNLADELVKSHKASNPVEQTELEKAIEESVAKAKEAGITSEFLLNYLRKAKTPEGARNLADELVKSHKASKQAELEKAIEESVAKAKEAGITSEFLLNYLRKAKTPEGARNLADELVKSHKASNPEKLEDKKPEDKKDDFNMDDFMNKFNGMLDNLKPEDFVGKVGEKVEELEKDNFIANATETAELIKEMTAEEKPAEKEVEVTTEVEEVKETEEEKEAEKPAEKESEKEAEKPAEKPAEKESEKEVEKPSKKATNKAAKNGRHNPKMGVGSLGAVSGLLAAAFAGLKATKKRRLI